MFNSLSGPVTAKNATTVYLQTEGIEWTITVSASTSAALPLVGQQARVFVHLYHREDQMMLFGFANEDERALFLDLLKVSGIGPRQAIRILSGMTVEEFIRNLDQDDVDALARLPGLGRKTAQKIILALRGRLSVTQEVAATPSNEMVEALVEMGFDRHGAQGAVEQTAKELEEQDLSAEDREREILRRSIVLLSSRANR